MNISNKKLFIIAFIFALIATLLIYFFLTKVQEESKQIDPTQNVVVAKVLIPKGTKISKEMLEIAELKADSIPPSAYMNIDDVLGQIVKENIYHGEVIIHNRIADDIYKKEHLAYSVPKGYRALSLQYNPVMGVAGFIQPGDYVDIIGSYDKEYSPVDKNVSKIIIQNILVLAVGNETDVNIAKDRKEEQTITLAVKPDDAERLAFTEEWASMKVILRPLHENSIPSTKGTTRENIFKVQEE